MSRALAYSDDPQVYDLADAVSDSLGDADRVADAIESMFPLTDVWLRTDMAAFAADLFTGNAKALAKLREAMAKRFNAYNDEMEN